MQESRSKKRDFWPKTKKAHEISSISKTFLSIFLGDFIENWGQRGEHGFFCPRNLPFFQFYFGRFRGEKIFKSRSSFSCESVLTYTLLIHIRKNFHPSNLWSQRGFCIYGQKHLFRGPKLERAAETIVLPSGPKFIWLVVHLDR